MFASATSGVGAAGANTETPGATMPVAGACLLMFGRGKSALTPATGKLFTDVVNPSYDNRRNNVWFRAGTVVGYLAVDGTFNGTEMAASFGNIDELARAVEARVALKAGRNTRRPR